MIVFHDMHETRTGDVDRVQRKYLSIDDDAAAESQMEGLGMAGRTILGMWKEVETGSSVAGIIAKDAEILEMALTARELVVRGNPDAQLWIDGIQPRLRTESAREFLSIINTADPSEWWKRICK
jgi:putative hydrolase of HD superfamily